MYINAISTSHTRPNPVSFGRVENIRYITPDEGRGRVISEGDLTINGQKGRFTYSFVQNEEHYYPISVLSIKDSNNNLIGGTKCDFPDFNLYPAKISKDVYFNENAFDTSEKRFKDELRQDANYIIEKSIAHMDSAASKPAAS